MPDGLTPLGKRCLEYLYQQVQASVETSTVVIIIFIYLFLWAGASLGGDLHGSGPSGRGASVAAW